MEESWDKLISRAKELAARQSDTGELLTWLTPIFGGGPMTRLPHPRFSLLFVVAYTFQFLNWLSLMRWTDADRSDLLVR